ncbi:MAG: penicillin-binding transpeptidase domain-containing protein [Clostridium sp.]
MKKKKKKKEFNRYKIFIVCMVITFTAILSKLIILQVRDVEYYREIADKNSHKLVTKESPRGEIYDKDGEILATNKQSYILTFTETDESKEQFYHTIDKVLKLLDTNGEKLDDGFVLKVNPFSLQFNVTDKSAIEWNDLRFKKDRGFSEEVTRDKFPKKKFEELDKLQREEVEEAIKNKTAEEVFNKLVIDYAIFDVVKTDYIAERWEKLSEEEKSTLDKKEWELAQGENWDGAKGEAKMEYLYQKLDVNTIRNYMIVKDKIRMQMFSGSNPVVIANDIKIETAFIFEQLQSDLPGISVMKQPIREYPNGDLASSILGYMRKINPSEQNKYEEKGYNVNSDYIGADGIESVFEDILKGTKGQESIEINKSGRKVKSLGEQLAYPGNNVKLTLDADIQRIMDKSLDETMEILKKKPKTNHGTASDVNTQNATRGAAVVLSAKTGEVLGISSRPGYDPNLFTVPGRLNEDEYRKYFNPDIDEFGREYIRKSKLTSLSTYRKKNMGGMNTAEREEYILNDLFPVNKDENGIVTGRQDKYDIYPKPLFNYATQTLVPPGSVFKSLTSVAGLEEGVIDKNTKVYDSGPYNKRYKEYEGASWKYNLNGSSHGSQNVIQAIADSNNYFMYDIADRLFEKGGVETKEGLNMLAKYAWKYGLGAEPKENANYSTGIEINEYFGQVYNYESSKKNFAVLYTQNIYELLNNGTNSQQNMRYSNIDIIPYNTDEETIRQIKRELTNIIKNEIENTPEDRDFNKDVESKLKELIAAYDTLNKDNYKNIVDLIKDNILSEGSNLNLSEDVKNNLNDNIKSSSEEKHEDLVNLLESEIINKAEELNISIELKDKVNNLIKISREENIKTFDEKDISKMIEVISDLARDAKEEIKSGTNLYNASIGQGLNQFTPVQLANYIATLVNGGNRYNVHLVDSITDAEGNVLKDYSEPQVIEKTGTSESTIETVKQGMLEATKTGTGSGAFKGFPIESGSKTSSSTFHNEELDMGRTTYALYGSFAPYDDPEIVVVVIIFDGGNGGDAGPVVRAIYEEYFKEEILKSNPTYKFMYPKEEEKKSDEGTSAD